MTQLTMGANAPLQQRDITLDVVLPRGVEADITALQTYAGGKVRGDGDMCFYNQPSISAGALTMNREEPHHTVFSMQLDRIPSEVEKIVIFATVSAGSASFGSISQIHLEARGAYKIAINTQGRSEAALILAEIYRRGNAWKLRHVGQGFNGGLKAIAEHYGVEVADDPAPAPQTAPTRAPAPAPAPVIDTTRRPSTPTPKPAPAAAPINLSKISLTKNDKTISLKKDDGRFGKIRVNLNWNQRPRKSGLLGLGSTAIDLDLGAFVEDVHGNITAVQALGNTFGDYDYFPYVKLLGDDRTGAVTDGEWIDINGSMWSEIHRVLIYAFIYEGTANWAETDGVVRIMVPGQPEIEVKMNEFGSNHGMCAVAYLENKGGQIKVSREVTFHRGHSYMDDAYGFGMRWRAGSK
jgi:tellurite resistance protein TerA